MYFFAFALLLLTLLLAVGGGILALLQLWRPQESPTLPLVEKVHWGVTLCLLVASACLLHGLYWQDYSLKYVADYTDDVLPLFYRLTAFWAGQPGSMLFWALAVGAMGTIFACTDGYRRLKETTRLWFWVFFLIIMAFFSLLLCVWNNPFIMLDPAPADGNGLNPLLQNPGMIFHPPLLFLGYGGFAVPTCLALAQALSRQPDETRWFDLTRAITLLAWAFLTAGIVLGMWWAYMELGWGGYWAWDPVENASLIPWLVGTAALHTAIIEKRRGRLTRFNVLLMGLTTLTTFFATFLVRGGIIESVHAFGSGSVGFPLGIFVTAGLVIIIGVTILSPAGRSAGASSGADKTDAPRTSSLIPAEDTLVAVAALLLAMGFIILNATMWPVTSALFLSASMGLEASFYNRVILPLCAVMLLLLAYCPWLTLNSRSRCIGLLSAAGSAAVLWLLGYQNVVALLTTAGVAGFLVALLLRVISTPVRQLPRWAGGLGLHLGLALMALGIAFSGPYKQEADHAFAPGDSLTIGDVTVTLKNLFEGSQPGYHFLEAQLEVRRADTVIGELTPQRRIYDKFGSMQFTEVDVIPGLGNEVYASLLGLDQEGRAYVKVSLEPLVNWIWIGGTLLCLFPLLMLRRRPQARRKDGENGGGR
ncbi:cytochrome c biogenesis protein CcsA [uncultured Desulfovibrio sp.]|uniref:heme lyase CcmF/NrfE family subunit n=1 Tax=uncultured Desulfovibrio sp. TaxID=167968 RepID=UPI0026172D69|nr:cytochrome c biogenesis protein CcsA [uncultured Desulfovibrio sp.]